MAKRNDMPITKKAVSEKTIPLVPVVANEPMHLIVAGTAKLNIREKPNQTASVLFVIPEGTEVLVDDVVRDWFHIHVAGNERKTGYILAQYAKEI